MLVPSIFDDFFDDWMSFPTFRDLENVDKKLYGKNAAHVMKTDVRDHDDHYEIDIDLPGFKKDEINLELNNGYLVVSAAKGLDEDQTDHAGKVIRQERYAGAMQRSYYVGEQITEEDVQAKFENGVLRLSMPKRDAKKLPEKKVIMIEG